MHSRWWSTGWSWTRHEYSWVQSLNQSRNLHLVGIPLDFASWMNSLARWSSVQRRLRPAQNLSIHRLLYWAVLHHLETVQNYFVVFRKVKGMKSKDTTVLLELLQTEWRTWIKHVWPVQFNYFRAINWCDAHSQRGLLVSSVDTWNVQKVGSLISGLCEPQTPGSVTTDLQLGSNRQWSREEKGNIRCCFLRTCRTKCSILRPTIPSASLGFSKRHQLTTHFGPNHRRAKWQCVLRILHVGLISPNIDFMHYLSGWFRIEPDEDIASRRSSDIACVSNGPHTSIGIHLTYRPHAS